MNMEIGDYLRKLRLENQVYKNKYKRLTTKKLMELSGVSDAHISLIENGKRKPAPGTLQKLAPHLGTTYEDLMIKAGYIDPAKTYEENIDTFLNYVKNNFVKEEDYKELEEIVRSFKKMSPEERQSALLVIKRLAGDK